MLVRRTNIFFVTASILWNNIILYMPISLVTSSEIEIETTTITTKTKKKFSNDPRIELENDITTGEKKAAAKAAEMLWREEVDDDQIITITSSSSTSSSDKLLKKIIMASRQQQQSGKPRNHYNYINNNHNNNNNNIMMMIYENEMISQLYGLNSTSVIDRTMISKLENQLLQQKQKQEEESSTGGVGSVGSVNGLSDYLLGMIHLYDFLTNNNKKDSLYSFGNGNDKNQVQQVSSSSAKAKAIYHLRRSANQGYVDAQCALGISLLLLLEVENDEENGNGKYGKEAIQILYKATKQYKKQPRSLWLLGKAIYFHGWTFDEEEIIITITKEQGVNKKKKVIKNIFQYNNNNNNNNKHVQSKLAIQYFQKAADENVPDAIHQLAILYEYDLIPHKQKNNHQKEKENASSASASSAMSMKKAELLYKKAHFLLKFPPSTYHLGLMYAYGRQTSDNNSRVTVQIIRQDYAKAIDYFRICAMDFMYAPCFRYLGILAVQGNKISSSISSDGISSEDVTHHHASSIPHDQYYYEEAIMWFDLCVQAEDKTVSDLCQWDMHQILSVMEKIDNNNK